MKKDAIIYKGRLISLETREVLLPNGHRSQLEVINHPGAVLIIPFLSADKVILLRQFRAVINTYLYELPAGTLKSKESHLSCAKREIVEETGFFAKRLTRLGYLYPVPGYSTEKIIVFKAQDLSPKQGNADEDEILETLVFTKAQVRKLLSSGNLVDAKTISAFAMCGWL